MAVEPYQECKMIARKMLKKVQHDDKGIGFRI